jgi:hypothetical protein
LKAVYKARGGKNQTFQSSVKKKSNFLKLERVKSEKLKAREREKRKVESSVSLFASCSKAPSHFWPAHLFQKRKVESSVSKKSRTPSADRSWEAAVSGRKLRPSSQKAEGDSRKSKRDSK